MVVEEEETIDKKRKEKEEDYDINCSLYGVFALDSFT
jgi:hypothetical protein